MTSSEQKVFWDIIDCPSAYGHKCQKIVNCQQGYCFHQVPEPWSGNLKTAHYLIIGSNPALDVEEIFPSKDVHYKKWIPVLNGGLNNTRWNNPGVMVEDFFEGRFGIATCGACSGTPVYVQYQNSKFSVLKHSFASATLQPVQNPYWETYSAICNAIATGNGRQDNKDSIDYAVTDVVHCKSPRQLGVNSALNSCLSNTSRVVDLFISQKATDEVPVVLLIGAIANKPEVVSALFERYSLLSSMVVGSYCIKKNSSTIKTIDIMMATYQFGCKTIRVYQNLPAPSPANRASSPITLYGQTIKW